MLTRRAVVALIGLGGLGVPRAGRAQSSSRIPRVGLLGERSRSDPFLAAFRQGLRELGYVEGPGIVIDARYADGNTDRFPELVAELIRLPVDVLVVGGTVAALSARAQTSRLPIVFTLAGDPVGSGLVASLARPGGNATGLSNLASELSGKQLELLKMAVPRLSRVAVLYNPDTPISAPALSGVRAAAPSLAVELHALEVRRPDELARAFPPLTAWRAGAVLALSDPVLGNQIAQLSKLAAEHRLPAMYARREFAEIGGLLAYGPSFTENYRRAAVYVDKILKGAKPADLPVEQPTKFELVINLKTARTLGLTMPPTMLERADHVIR